MLLLRFCICKAGTFTNIAPNPWLLRLQRLSRMKARILAFEEGNGPLCATAFLAASTWLVNLLSLWYDKLCTNHTRWGGGCSGGPYLLHYPCKGAPQLSPFKLSFHVQLQERKDASQTALKRCKIEDESLNMPLQAKSKEVSNYLLQEGYFLTHLHPRVMEHFHHSWPF